MTQQQTRQHSSKTSKKITHHSPTHSTTHQHTQSNTNQKGSQRRGSNPRPVPDILLQDKRESLYRLSYEGNYVGVLTSGHDTIVTAFETAEHDPSQSCTTHSYYTQPPCKDHNLLLCQRLHSTVVVHLFCKQKVSSSILDVGFSFCFAVG